MKVVVIPSWYPTKYNPNNGTFFKEQAVALQEYGIDITIAFPEVWNLKAINKSKNEKGFSYDVEDNLKTYRMRGYDYLPKIPHARRILYVKWLSQIFDTIVKEQGKPDIIHAHSALWGGWGASILSRKYGIPFVITEHSSAYHRNIIKSYQKPYIKKTFDNADKIISVGQSLRKDLEYYVDPNRVEIIPNIVNLDNFKMNSTSPQTEKFTFFSLGFLRHIKGFDILIRAFANSFKGQEQVQLVIGGEGEERGKLEDLAKKIGIKNQIAFIGELSREEVVHQMQLCNAFVLSSRYETFGVVCVEALACGKPVIATKCGGPETIVNKQNGLLCKVGSIEELSKALLNLKSNYHKYNKENIRNDCILRFGKKNVCKQIIEVYKDLKLLSNHYI